MTFAQKINAILRRVPAWPIYILMILPVLWYFYQGATGALGPEPISELQHRLGKLALQIFIVVLAITPLRTYTKISLIKYRRALGLAVFFLVSVHLSVWLILDVGDLGRIWKDIIKRPYITIGMTAFALIIPLAITSNNLSIRKLGPQAWKRLHQLAYLAVILGATHNVMVQKVWELQPLIYLGLIVALLVTRTRWASLRAVA